MFNNIGDKIKTLVEIFTAFFLLFAGVGFFLVLVALIGVGGEEGLLLLVGIIVLIPTGLLNCMIIYGFGKLIEMVERIEKNTSKSKEEKALEEKIKKLDCWKEQELITEKEYEVMKNKLLSPDDMLSTIKKKYEAGEITEQQYKEMRMKILNNLLR